jgi:hypothetical protein
MTSGVVGKVLHFKKTDLIQTSGEDVDNMTVVCGALGEVVIELNLISGDTPRWYSESSSSYLNSLLVVLDVVAINVVVRTDRLLQLGRNDISWSLGGGTTDKVHDAASSILEGGLQQANRHTQGHTGATESTLIVCHGPGVTLQLLEYVGDLEFGLLHG